MNTELALIPHKCPLCRGGYSIPEAWVGRKVECPHCHEQVKFGVANELEPAPAPPSPPILAEPRQVSRKSSGKSAKKVIVIGIVLVAVGLWSVVMDHSTSRPKSESETASERAEAARLDAERKANQPKRLKSLEAYIEDGIITKLDVKGGEARLFVGRPFYVLTIDKKELKVGNVWEYAATESGNRSFTLHLMDGYNGKEIGTFDRLDGLKLK